MDDQQLVLDFLIQQKYCWYRAQPFWPEPDHLRIVFLPVKDEINKAIGKLGEFFGHLYTAGNLAAKQSVMTPCRVNKLRPVRSFCFSVQNLCPLNKSLIP